MPQFLFQLKGKAGDSAYNNWQWPPVWSDKVEATDRKDAHAKIESDFGKKFPLRVLQKDIDSNEFLLVIKEIKPDDHHTLGLFENRECKQCGTQFKMIEKYQQGNSIGGGTTFCSFNCNDEFRRVDQLRITEANILSGNHVPVIYRITNKITGLCYVGKTTQVFTLRWYQHFFQGCGTEFHNYIKQYKITDWIFEVVEIVELPADCKQYKAAHRFILQREMFHINQNDSIANGYNTTASLKEKEEEMEIEKFQIALFGI